MHLIVLLLWCQTNAKEDSNSAAKKDRTSLQADADWCELEPFPVPFSSPSLCQAGLDTRDGAR